MSFPLTQEQQLIEAIARCTGSDSLGDDAFYDPQSRLIYTTDMLVEGRHFDWRWFSPADLGWKAAAVNFSDVAAMGGQALYLLVSLALPEDKANAGFVSALYEGLSACCKTYGARIVGGDTVSGPATVISVTAVGFLPQGHTPGLRKAARAGDYVITTGFHGLSAAGLEVLCHSKPGFEMARQRHLHPLPRMAEGLLLSKTFERYALIDSSDGLADALLRLAGASGVDIRVEADALPVYPEVAALENPRQAILYGGEDFELVAAVPGVTDEITRQFSVIGRVLPQSGVEPLVLLTQADGSVEHLRFDGVYQHFGGETHV